MRHALLALILSTASAASAETVEAPVDVRAADRGRVASGPTVHRNGDQVEIRFEVSTTTVCDYAEADGKLYVTDSVNRRIVVVAFDHADERTLPLP